MMPKGEPPKRPDKLAEWIFDHGPVTAIRVEYRQTGADTADTYCHLTGWDMCGAKKAATRECRPENLRAVADLAIGYNSILDLKHGLDEEVKKWREYEKANAREISEYNRLKAKFG